MDDTLAAAHARLLLCLALLAGPVLAGCLSERTPAPAPIAAAESLPVGATWSYAYSHERVGTTVRDGETTRHRDVTEGVVDLTLVDGGVTPNGVEAIALNVVARDDIRIQPVELLDEGVYLLAARDHAPLAGPRGELGWDARCSETLDDAVAPFWPLRFPLVPHTERTDVTKHGAFHVYVGGEEAVETPAGTFDALRIDVHPGPLSPDPEQHRRVTFWYAPQVQQFVKMERDYVSVSSVLSSWEHTSHSRATFELVSHSLAADPDAAERIRVLDEAPAHSSGAAIAPVEPVEWRTRIVTDRPRMIPVDEAERILVALERYAWYHTSPGPHDNPHPDVYSLQQADWGDTEIEWSVREGHRPWRDVGSGPGATITTTNVTRLVLQATIRPGEDLVCLNGSSEPEQHEFLTRFTTYEWAGRVAVPPGTTDPLPLLALPGTAGGVEVVFDWQVQPQGPAPVTESGRPVADCDWCGADAAPAGEARWEIWEEDAPLDVRWQPGPTAVGPAHVAATTGQTVQVELRMLPLMYH